MYTYIRPTASSYPLSLQATSADALIKIDVHGWSKYMYDVTPQNVWVGKGLQLNDRNISYDYKTTV